MAHRELKPQELDRVFIGARAAAAASEPSDALMDKVMQQALAAMPAAGRPVAAVRRPAQPRLHRLWAALTAGFGGGGVVASLGAVAVVALFLGYTAPAGFAEDLIPQTDAGADSGIELEPVAIYFLAGG